jgi:hypothetical protein
MAIITSVVAMGRLMNSSGILIDFSFAPESVLSGRQCSDSGLPIDPLQKDQVPLFDHCDPAGQNCSNHF